MNVTARMLILIVLGAMFVSLFGLSMGTNASGSMSHCPFAAHEDVLCTMHVGEHIDAWKSTFLASVTSLATVLAAISGNIWFAPLPPNLLRRLYYIHSWVAAYIRELTYTFTYRPLQEYFARGILHPKVF